MKFNLILIFFLFILNSISVYADKISIVTEDLPPLNYKKNGEITGITTDIVKEILKRTKTAAKINLYTWRRAYLLAKSKKNILIYSIAKTQDRVEFFKWIGPVISWTLCVYSLKDRTDIVINKINDAKKYKLGVIKNDAIAEGLIKYGFVVGKNLVYSRDDVINLKNLFARRIDLVAKNDFFMETKIKKLGYDINKIKKVFTVPTKFNFYLAFNKNTSDKIVKKFEKAFEEIMKDGTYTKIINSYSEMK